MCVGEDGGVREAEGEGKEEEEDRVAEGVWVVWGGWTVNRGELTRRKMAAVISELFQRRRRNGWGSAYRGGRLSPGALLHPRFDTEQRRAVPR